jgi:hypothetical protein
MNKNGICSLCCRLMKEAITQVGLCEQCIDLLEFGYLSFPAYELVEKEKVYC